MSQNLKISSKGSRWYYQIETTGRGIIDLRVHDDYGQALAFDMTPAVAEEIGRSLLMAATHETSLLKGVRSS